MSTPTSTSTPTSAPTSTRRRPRSHRTLLVALTIGVTALTGACASSAGAPNAASTSALASAGPVTITLWHGLGGAAGEAFTKVVQDYNATNTDQITVDAIYQGSYEDALAKYTAAARDGSTPDVMLTNDITTGYMHDLGQSVTASDLAAANPGSLDLDQLEPAARNYYTAGDQLLAVPFNTSMPLLYVNTDLLSEAGVEPATLTTMRGLDAAARKVAQALPGTKGVVQPSAGGWWFEQMTAAAGEAYCSPDNGRTGDGASAVSLTGATQQQAFATMAGLGRDGVALQVGDDGDAALNAFASGQVAMMFNSSGAIGGLTKAGMEDYTALPVPLSGPEGSSGPLIGGGALWVSGENHSEVQQAASWKLISYLSSAAVQEQFAQASGYVPVNTQVASSSTRQAYLAANPAAAAAATELAEAPVTTATAGCLTGALPTVRKTVIADLSQALSGQGDLAPALAEAERHATQDVAEYRAQAGE